MAHKKLNLLLFSVLVLLTGGALAGSAERATYDRVSLSSSASAEVTNDRMVAVLFAMEEGRDAVVLADRVNTDVQWAVSSAKAVDGVKVTTEGYNSSPVYRDNRIAGWRVRQSIRLESSDPARLGKLIGALQERLQVQSLGNEVTEGRLDSVRDQLTRDALAAFSERAGLIAGELGGSGYRIVSLHVGDVGAPPMMRPAVMEMRAAVSAPAIEPGSRSVRMQVDGVIELTRP